MYLILKRFYHKEIGLVLLTDPHLGPKVENMPNFQVRIGGCQTGMTG